MRTKKEISTVSYNTEAYLKEKLDYLMSNYKISDYMYIYHKHEEDELKDHFHLWIKPNTLIDTMKFQEVFKEFDPKMPDKPLKCIDFRSSNSDDWILYCIHDKKYLLSKGETRVFHYSKEDIKFSDPDTFEYNWYHAIHQSKWAEKQRQINDIFEFEKNKVDLIRQGRIPLQLATQLQALDKLQRTYRGTHSPHDEV